MRTWSSTSLRSVPAKRSAKAFISGGRIDVRTTRTPDDLNTPANRVPSFVSWSQTTTRGTRSNGGVPGVLRAPLVGRCIRHRGVEDRPATQVQEEEYKHLAEPHVDGLDEVARPRHMISKERRPTLPDTPGGRERRMYR